MRSLLIRLKHVLKILNNIKDKQKEYEILDYDLNLLSKYRNYMIDIQKIKDNEDGNKISREEKK